MPSKLAKQGLGCFLVCIVGFIYLNAGIRKSEDALNQSRDITAMYLLSKEIISVMNSELNISDPMEKTVKRIHMIKDVCGDLCDTSKEIEPGEFIGSVTAKVKGVE